MSKTRTVYDFAETLAWLHSHLGQPVYVTITNWPARWQSVEIVGILAEGFDLGSIPALSQIHRREPPVGFIVTRSDAPEGKIGQVIMEPDHFRQALGWRENGQERLSIELVNQTLQFDVG